MGWGQVIEEYRRAQSAPHSIEYGLLALLEFSLASKDNDLVYGNCKCNCNPHSSRDAQSSFLCYRAATQRSTRDKPTISAWTS